MIVIIIILIVIVVMWMSRVEHYYNITPYKLHWDMYKCLSYDCITKRSHKCYEYCQNLKERERKLCEIECLNEGDRLFDSIKWQDYTWGKRLNLAQLSREFNQNDYVLEKA